MNATNPLAERRVAIDELDRSIVNLCARINAANYELLVLIREFDERAGFLKWGLSNCTQWLHWRCDLSLSAAREKIRVAHALKDLPEISRAFSTGTLSYSKVRALTRIATPSNESSFLDFAMTTTAARVEERCRQLRNSQPESAAMANRVHQGRSLRTWRNAERGTMTITVEVPIEDGELIDQALSKAIESGTANGPEFASTSLAAQQADALIDVCKSYLHGTSDSRSNSGDAYQVVIHVDHSALTRGEGRSDLPVESVKRLTCDGSTVTMSENARGEPLSIGRKQRTVPTAINRALWARDRGCSFPGCTHTRYVDAHHVQHWADGGETSLDNLMLLCTQHHRLVHEEGYEVHRDIQNRWYFRRPDGRAIPDTGYLPDDMLDDDVAGRGLESYPNTSAEASSEPNLRCGHAGVREAPAAYWSPVSSRRRDRRLPARRLVPGTIFFAMFLKHGGRPGAAN
jgi:hypothetical protein